MKSLPKKVAARWTYEAMLCYRIGCVCSKCPHQFLETKCRMKEVVLELVRLHGAPTEDMFKFYQKLKEERNNERPETWKQSV